LQLQLEVAGGGGERPFILTVVVFSALPVSVGAWGSTRCWVGAVAPSPAPQLPARWAGTEVFAPLFLGGLMVLGKALWQRKESASCGI